MVSIVALAGCDEIAPSPVAQACERLDRALFDSSTDDVDLGQRCSCIDQTSRTQLDPKNYELLTKLAQEVVSDGGARRRAQNGADDLSTFAAHEGPGGSAIAALDFALLTHKAIARCTKN